MVQGTMGQPPVRKKISLASGFASAINLPRHIDVEGDFPLYPHGVDSKIQMKRSLGWYKAAERTYNSPSNARVVCLSNDGANVLYWVKPIKDNKMIGLLELASPYVFDKTAKKGVEQHINAQQYTWDNAGLQSLVNPVVLSNIEELWVSAEIFNCDMYRPYYNQLCSLQPGQVAGVSFLTEVLEKEISTGSKSRTIAATFPLLRAIVVVKTVTNSPVQDFHRCALRTNEVKNILETKYPQQRRTIGENSEIMQQLAQKTGFGFAVQPIPTGDILKFSLGDYKYDQRVLSGVREKLFAKYSPQVTESVTTQPTNTENARISELLTKIRTVGGKVVERYEGVRDGLDAESCAALIKEVEKSKLGFDILHTELKTLLGKLTDTDASDTRRKEQIAEETNTEILNVLKELYIKAKALRSVPEPEEETEDSSVSLAAIIQSMEDNSYSPSEIKRALWAYKQSNPEFVLNQVQTLPKDMYDKYAAALK